MADSRTGAAAVPLPDGRTLIAGGLTAAGESSDSVVVYDPLSNSTSVVGQLLERRVGHTATLLRDGRVVVAGGTMNGIISADLEIFDPGVGISTLAATMAQPRTGHAAVLSGDVVLLVGGTGLYNAVLSTVERFDPDTGSVTMAGSLTTPRFRASATTLIDGRVLIAGGSSGSADLRSAEIYEPWSQTSALIGTQLSVARSGHTAVLLSQNAGVLIAGGGSNGAPQASADLFLPAEFPDPFTWGIGTFAATGPMAAARDGAVGGPAGEGYAFVAGGGSVDAERYRFATIKTDKGDYAPGERAVITGSGWQPGEDVRLLFQEDPAVHDDYVLTVRADAAGNIFHDQWAPEAHDLGVRFYLLASGSKSRAQTVFTDGQVPADGVTIGAQDPNPVVPGGSARYEVQVAIAGNNATCTVTLEAVSAGTPVLPSGTTLSFTLNGTPNNVVAGGGGTSHTRVLTISTPATIASNTTFGFTVRALQGQDCQNQNTRSASGTLAVGAASVATTTMVASTPNPSFVNESATFTATVKKSGDNSAVTTGTVSFIEGGTCAAPAATHASAVALTASGEAQFSTSTLSVGTHSIVACYSGASGFDASSGTTSHTVNLRTTTTTVSFGTNPVFVNQSSLVTLTVEDTAAGTKSAPLGTVAVTGGANDSFSASSCTLAATGAATSSCTVTVTPSAASVHTISAAYSPASTSTGVHDGSKSTGDLTVNLRTTTTMVVLLLGTISEGGNTLVTATVSDIAGAGTLATPAGMVAFSSSVGSDLFVPVSCSLNPTTTAGVATCVATVMAPDDRAPGTLPYSGSTVHIVTGTYVPAGSSLNVHAASYGADDLTVTNVSPIVGAITGLPTDPVPLGSSGTLVSMNATHFTDAGTLDTHTCEVTWGDASSETLIVTQGNGSGSCGAMAHTYLESGVYPVTVTVTDDDGGVGSSRFEYVVVYPPDGHVTGGGWIDSPIGAYAPDVNLVGKANFGFVSKYKKGQSIPDGQTEFQFKAGNLDFHSTSYEWLVVAGSRAQFFGSGKIKGVAKDYWFKLTANDGQASGGGGKDKFRIKIWEKTASGGDGPVLYDNQMGKDDNGNFYTELGGGSIVIHSPK